MTEPLDRTKPFRDMADQIAANIPANFAGAYVIVTPSGEVISTALLDPQAHDIPFWTVLKTRIEIAYAEAQEKDRGGQSGWPGQGRR